MSGILTTAMAAFLLVAACLPATAQQSSTPTTITPKDIEGVVRDYLLKHPEIIVQALETYKRRAEEAERDAARQTISQRKDSIQNDPDSPVGGNPNGDVTIVEFFDYRCGVCKRVHGTVAELIKGDANIRRVYKEWPILGPESVFATRAALASRAQGKYLGFHDGTSRRSDTRTGHADRRQHWHRSQAPAGRHESAWDRRDHPQKLRIGRGAQNQRHPVFHYRRPVDPRCRRPRQPEIDCPEGTDKRVTGTKA